MRMRYKRGKALRKLNFLKKKILTTLYKMLVSDLASKWEIGLHFLVPEI